MKNRGFSTVELLVSFVIIAFVAIALFKTVLELLDKVSYYQLQSQITIAKGNIINSIQKDLNQRKLYGIDVCGCDCYDITYQDLTVKHLLVNKADGKIQYGGITEQIPDEFSIAGDLAINRSTLTTPSGQNNTILKIYLPINNIASGLSSNINIVYQYDNRDIGNLPAYVETTTGGTCPITVNKPALANGMVPIKWDGTNWVDTTITDTSWYDYSTKTWANARTADGSMWVWIPRYIYRISSGWHTNTNGTVDIKFSTGTDDSHGGTISVVNTGVASDSNGKWSNEPAFTFGNKELTGFWVAKFEPSGTTNAIDIKPNATTLRGDSMSAAFDTARSMEKNDRYGWGTSGTNIDTHMMKNTEWGAVYYLTLSSYGKNAKVWINNSSTYTTGCAGDAVSAAAYAGCQFSYEKTNGQQASTTGNIYGVYDMSGGAYDYMAAYVNNGNAVLNTNGASIIAADIKYKNVYPITTDSAANNYNGTSNFKGDTIYETSSSYSGNNSWYGDSSIMPNAGTPWIMRGGANSGTTYSGMLYFNGVDGAPHSTSTFRPIILVGSGL